MRFFEILTMLCAAMAALILLSTVTSVSAPQQAAGAAIAIALVAIPYCVTGVLQRRAMRKD